MDKNIRISFLILTFFSFTVLHCKDNGVEPHDLPLQLNDTSEVSYHDTISNINDSIWMSFDSIVTDTRCPYQADCVTGAGDIVVKVTFYHAYEEKTLLLCENQITPGFSNNTTIAGYYIKLIAVLPYPDETVILPKNYLPEHYKVRILVSK